MTLGGMFEIMRDVDSCLLGSIYQVVTDAGWTNIWAQSVADKTNLWLNVVNTNIPFSALSGDTHASQYASWIAQYATSGSINLWSTAAVLKLQGMIASHYNSQNWGAVLAA
ncbi:MAG: hypothetical protein KGQ49_05890, partial [Verrucomicrobia bacterium]|nr:hypothetical protein [Verrucomicrobiota bacterium]